MSNRRTFTPQQKSQIVLDLLKENKTIAEIAAEYEIHPNQLLRWKSEAMEKMHLLFNKDSDEVDKIKKKHDAEVEDLTKQIGQLTIEVNWLKKNLASNKEYTERCAMVEKDNKNISVKRQGELLSINRTSLYYKPVGIPDEEIALIKLYYKRRHIT